jgi:hypothetical protein
MVLRGCGTRNDGGLYIGVPTSPYGKPIEWFIVDPVRPLKGKLPRSPLVFPDNNGINHLVLGIGQSFYPFFPDFLEEARIHGVSKKIPVDFNLAQLTPNKSALLLAHPRAIPLFEYDLRREFCPLKMSDRPNATLPHQCTGDLWDLSSVHSVKYGGDPKHEVIEREDDEWVEITTPSCTYHVMRAYYPNQNRMERIYKYDAGVVLKFPRFNFEFVDKPDGKVDPSRKERDKKRIKKVLTDLGYEFQVVEE